MSKQKSLIFRNSIGNRNIDAAMAIPECIWSIFVSILVLVISSDGSMVGKRLPDLYWNTSNPIFRIDNTEHIIDVSTTPLRYDKINIICPHYPRSVPESETEQFVIYHVTEEEYDTCQIRSQHPKIIFICDRPYVPYFLTISFRSFSPMPGSVEYKPGRDYHFMSTSTKGDLHRRIDGMCKTNNMKVVFKVSSPESKNVVAAKIEENNKSRSEEDSKKKTVKNDKSDLNGGSSTPPPSKKSRGQKPMEPPKTLDYFLSKTRGGDEVLQKNLVQQEASTRFTSASAVASRDWRLVLVAIAAASFM